MKSLILAEALDELIDHRGKTPRKLGADFTETGVPVASAMLVADGTLNLAEARNVSHETYSRWMKTPMQKGDVLLTSEAPLGRVARVPSSEPLVLGQRLYGLRGKPGILDNGYLFYALQTAVVQNDLIGRSSGTTVFGIRQSALRCVEIPAPSLSEQQAIAEVLGALDDEIAANTNLINTADELSHAIYRTMFDGSSPVPLSDTAQFINGKAFTKDASGTGRVVVRIAELNSGLGGSTVYSDIDVPDQHVARPGDLLFAWSGSLTLHRWFRKEAIVNQHIFKVSPNNGYPLWLVYELVRQKLEEFKAIAADKATTMGHIQRKHLDEPVPAPSRTQIAAKDDLMSALWQRGLEAQMENETLAATRDSLLPRLISGGLRVKDVNGLA